MMTPAVRVWEPPGHSLTSAMRGNPWCRTAVQISSAGVERNAIIGDDEVRRAQDIPIIQVGGLGGRLYLGGGWLTGRKTGSCGVHVHGTIAGGAHRLRELTVSLGGGLRAAGTAGTAPQGGGVWRWAYGSNRIATVASPARASLLQDMSRSARATLHPVPDRPHHGAP